MATVIPSNDVAFTVWEIAAATGGDLTLGRAEGSDHARGVVSDSRAVAAGNAFVAVRGEAFDGHDFVASAVARGASVVVVERGRASLGGEASVVEVDDTVAAFGALARAHLRQWRKRGAGRRVAAVTGSAGKTTTKDLLAGVLAELAPCHATRGNLNNRVGVPAVALALTDPPFAVFEVGMSLPGEIAALASIVEPDVGVLVNVGVAHAAGFGGSRGAIAREKGALLEALGADGVAVVNLDDEAAFAQRLRTRARVATFGVAHDADVRVDRCEATSDGRSLVILSRGGDALEVTLAVPGQAVAVDFAAAVAAADALVGSRVPDALVARAASRWSPAGGRSVLVELAAGVAALDDSYNANPGSMRAAFQTLAELRRRRKGSAIVVLGEMRELGPLTESEHEALGDELARHAFDLVIGCGGAVDAALRRAESRGVAVRYARDAEEAGALVAACVVAGDTVLFKGSRGAAVERALAHLVARYPRVTTSGGANA